jgi:cysteine desulfurase/selenocysteine lyase
MKRKFQIDEIRSEFPILQRSNRGKPIAYLDNAASSQKPHCVIDSVSKYYQNFNSNVHRGIYELAEDAEKLYADSRQNIANYLSVHPDEIIFVRGATEGLNLIAHCLGQAKLSAGDIVILSDMEHHANIVPWQMICEQLGAKIEVVSILPDGSLDMERLEELLLLENSKILSLCSISNTLGTVNPIKEITSKAHENGTLVVIDGAQSIPHERPNLKDLDCDFFVFSGHKVFGPMGIGVAYGKAKHLEDLPPYQGGGDMIDQVSFKGTTFAPSPQRFEAGTPNVAGAIGLGEAIQFLSQFDMREIHEHEMNLLKSAREELLKINGFQEHGTTLDKAAVLSFSIESVHPHDLASILDAEGVATRTGHHCCQPLMEKLGTVATARASFAFYNTVEEVLRFTKATEKAVTILR